MIKIVLLLLIYGFFCDAIQLPLREKNFYGKTTENYVQMHSNFVEIIYIGILMITYILLIYFIGVSRKQFGGRSPIFPLTSNKIQYKENEEKGFWRWLQNMWANTSRSLWKQVGQVKKRNAKKEKHVLDHLTSFH